MLAGNAFNDPRMISVLGVLMGIDMEGFARPEGSDELPPGYEKAEPKPSSPPPTQQASTSTPKPSSTSGASSSKPAPKDTKMAEPEPEEPEEEDEEALAKKAALAEKAKGNDAYKNRNFDAAIEHFTKAWDSWPKDITFLTNKAGKLNLLSTLGGF
jgi:stress-induced-phosphoprotein 1